MVELCLRDRGDFSNDDVIAADLRARANDSIAVQLVVRAMLAARCLFWVRPGELLLRHEHLIVRPVEYRSEEATVDRALVEHNRVLLVVARVAGDGNDRVAASCQLLEAQVLHALGGHERFLRIVEHVGERVHSHLVVRGVDSHRLLAHGALVCVPRRLVVVGEGNDRGADAKDHRRMDLAMRERHRLSPLTIQVSETHGDHSRLFFLDIDELDKAFLAARLEVPSAARFLPDCVSWRSLSLLILVKHHLDVPLSQLQLVVLNDVEGALNAASIRAKLDFFAGEIAHNANFALDA